MTKAVENNKKINDSLPTGWEIAQVKDICDIIRGVSYKKPDSIHAPQKGYLPILRATNIQDNSLVLDKDLVYVPSDLVSEHQRLKIGDIVIATSSGSKHLVGKTAQVKKNWSGAFGAFCAAIRSNVEIDYRYLGYFFNSPAYKDVIAAKAIGVNINNLRRGDIEELKMPIAPENEQKRIVAEIEKQFSRLDEAVDNLKRVKANLKRYKASVLKAAVEGKLTGAWRKANPDVESAGKLLERILAERRKKWEEAELAKMKAKGKEPKDDKWKKKYKEPDVADKINIELPKGWVIATVKQLSNRVQYGSSSKTNEDSDGITVLRMGNLFEGHLLLDKLKYLPKSHDEFPKLLLEPDDLLFNRTNSPELVGKTAVYKGKPYPCSFASYLIRARFINGVDPNFICYFINSNYGRQWIKSVVSQQVGQANVNGTKLQALSVPLPPHNEQGIIVLEVENKFSIIDGIEKEVDRNLIRADRLRQSVLKKAFSGKLIQSKEL